MDVNNKIREITYKKGLSQQIVADKAGLHRNGFRNIVTGECKSPRLLTLQRICDALSVGMQLTIDGERMTIDTGDEK